MAVILETFIGSCIKKLQQIINDEAVQTLGVEDDISEVLRRMGEMQYFLSEADNRRIEESAVDNLVCGLRDALYDADDIIDLAKFEGSKLLMDNRSSSSRNTVCSVLSVLSCFCNLKIRRKVSMQIKILNDRLKDISGDNTFWTLNNDTCLGKYSETNHRTSSHLVEPMLVGNHITISTAKLVDLVLVNKEKQNYKIGIVGTVGIGKTTLAQKVYNHQRMVSNFSKRAWICVSQDYSEVNLLIELLQCIGAHDARGETVEELQSKIASTLNDQSLFLVLDDIWHSDIWTNLFMTPVLATTRVIILVTTRDYMVAQSIGAEHIHWVQLLSVDVGWELLWKTMNIKEEKEVENLREVGFEIVKKCGSLPLAIRFVASVLETKEKTETQWREVLTDNALSMRRLPAELRGALYLSYYDLPRHLKQCFLYFALFPEDHVICRDELIWLWVAEGFVQEQEGQILEDTAEEYYYELIYRNLLDTHPSYMDYSKCRMHNLFWHLARHISRKECFSGDSKMVEFQHISNLRRITLITKKDMVVLSNLYTGKVKIRTLILSNIISARVDSTIFVKLPHLRVLDLSGSPIQQIPADVKCLIHLRLLNLDRTDIACIPECIGSLTNLQILNLQECYALFTLPMRLTCLCNLRRLGLSRTPITQVPKGIGRLTFLNDLEGFPLGHDCGNDKMQNGWDLRELEGLLLVKKLDIIKLERTIPCCAESLFIHKHHLKILSMRCTERQFHPSREEADWIEGVFEELVPPRNLEDLSIIGFFGRRYSSWLISHLPSVKFLKLVYCICWEQLPPLGQLPNMTFLKIKGAFSVNKIGHEFLGGGLPAVGSKMVAFPKLEVLIIEHMPYWEEWSLVEENKEGKRDDADSCHTVKERGPTQTGMLPFLPCLQRLELLECPKLRALPQQLAETTSLNQLLIRGANSLKVVKNLPYISGELRIDTCRSLKRVSNLPLLRCLYISGCPALRVVDKFGNLQLLGLSKHILDRSSLWLSDLQHEYRQLQGKDLRIITWDPTLVIKL